eukprot:CAMPEP_0115322326 /NCGR_PEP_ID=MMETSP0270-20121206/81342_1 /TAXON_ID=71861 /ORGANISM="Scrippsiella trochoidea, Strain CCMP3099" /LENGTH=68 /DNA_ID=CAMNT_0002742283 /DNA_START=1 /DNA_END=203 /DNA_ORIENTATION=-
MSACRHGVRAASVLRFCVLGQPLYASLWLNFTWGFSFDHFLKGKQTYSSTQKDRKAPCFMELLRVHVT